MYKPLDKADATFFELAQGDIVTAEIWNNLNRFYINQGNTVVDAVNVLQNDITHLEERYQHLGIYYGAGEAPSWAYLQIVPTGDEGLSLITWPYVVERLEQTYALGKKTPEGGEIFNDYENNLAQGNKSHAEGYSTTASGNYSHAEGNCAKASGNSSHAEGVSSTAAGGCSHAEGYNTTASGPYSHAEGYNTTASGSYSHAEGASTLASRHYSHAEGKSSTASGASSHAEGEGTIASGYSSHAEGWSSTASGSCSHTEGSSTRAFGGNSHAEGDSTTASGARSHAEGFQTIACGDNSHASGEGTIASGVDQTAVGKYNQENQDALFIVGNGQDESVRSNAFEVLKDGSAALQTTGTTPNSITTKQYVDSEIQSSVDVNYSPTSARAQSGIAVSEALASIPNNDFVLIGDATLAEPASVFKFSSDLNGNPLNQYKDFFFYFYGSTTLGTTNQAFAFNSNGGYAYFMWNYVGNVDANMLFGLWHSIEEIGSFGDLQIFKSTYSNSALLDTRSDGSSQGLYQNNKSVSSDFTVRNLNGEITDIKFFMGGNTDNAFTAGSRCMLFGRARK